MSGAATVEPSARAHAWAAAGFAKELVPVCGPRHRCDSPGKIPHFGGWQTRSFSPHEFGKSWPNTGLRTRLFPAIDIDVEDAAVVAAVEDVAREILGTTARRSRRNSARCALLYRLDGEPFKKTRIVFESSDGSAGKIEVLGDGQQLVVDGIHASGAPLEWTGSPIDGGSLASMNIEARDAFLSAVRDALEAAGCHNVELDHAERNGERKPAPDPVAATDANRARKYADGAIAKARREIEGKPEGERNDELNRQAFGLGQLVGGGVASRDVVEAELTAAALRVGLTESETRASIRSGLDAGARDPRGLPSETATDEPPPPESEDPPPPESENPPGPGSTSANTEPWPDPEPFDRIAVPEFPTELLPDWQRRFVEAVALETETRPDLAAMCVLTATAAACARRFAIEQRPGFHVPANLWTLTMLSSGNRKSAVFDRTVTPLREYEAEQALALAPRIAVERSQHRRLERLLAKAEKAAVDAKEDLARRAAQAEADQVAEQLQEHKVTHEPCLFLAEATPERLEEVLMEQGGRAAVLASEPALLRALAGLGNGSRNGGDPNLSSILDAHDGGDVRVGRMRRDNGGGGDRIVRGAVVTIGLAPQPERVFSALRAGPAFLESGFAWRFLFSLPDTLLGHRTHGTPPTPGAVLAEYAARMRELLALPEADVIPVLRLTPEAHEALLAFERQLEPAMLPEGELAAAIPWASKLTSRLARIAGLLHAAENRCDPWLSPIEFRVMERAIALADYFIPHARAVLLELGSDPIVKRARRALEWIRRERIAAFTKHDLHRAIAKNEAAGAAEAVIDPVIRFLEGRDYIHAGAGAEKRTGRPPSPSYNVNPKVHEAKHGE